MSMKHRDSKRGIALVASLVILAALVTIGVGGMFLSQMNLGIAENTRASAIAANNANAGLDSIVVYLSTVFQSGEADDRAYPEDLSGFVGPSGYEYEVLEYRRVADDRAVIRVRGSVQGRNASHVSEALIFAVETTSDPTGRFDPLFGQGLVTNGSIKFPGNAQVDINMWAGGDIEVTGSGQTTVSEGVGFVAAGTTCRIGSIDCSTDPPGPPPNAPAPDFDVLRESVVRCMFGDYSGDCADVEEEDWDTITVVDLCAGVTSVTRITTGVNDPPVVCLPPNASYTTSEDNVTIIGDRTTTVTVTGDVHAATIVSGTVDLSSQSTMTGMTTIFAAEDIVVRKGFSALDDLGTVGAFIATEGDVTVRGNGNRDIYAVIWSGGEYIINGAAQTMITNVVSASATMSGSLRANGNNGLVRQAERIDNVFIPGPREGGGGQFGGTYFQSVRR